MSGHTPWRDVKRTAEERRAAQSAPDSQDIERPEAAQRAFDETMKRASRDFTQNPEFPNLWAQPPVREHTLSKDCWCEPTVEDFSDIEWVDEGETETGVLDFSGIKGLLPGDIIVKESGEVRVVDPVTGGAKGQKLARFDLIPAEPLRRVAEHYGLGARKYADRNWELGYAWSLSFGALQRHLWQFWGGEDLDEETGAPHLAAAAFHVLALLEFMQTHPELDDRSGS